jgi:hypothetical protein
MSKAVAVKEAVKETLMGSEEPVQVSAQTKARFNSNAVKDPESGELFMGHEEFINAVAPSDEDYVSQCPAGFSGNHHHVARKLTMLPEHSTRSSETSIASYSRSQIVKTRAVSPCQTGPTSRTF